jgi:hypothetical protein
MTACMRWQPGRLQTWRRPEDGGFDPSQYGVAALGELDAKHYVLDRHYSGAYPAASQRFGLFDLADQHLAGVAVLSVPVQARVLTAVFPDLEPYVESLELGRFVLDDEVAANGESWFLAQIFRMAADCGIRGVVSFSDPLPRQRADGTLIMPGHVGIIYQASNAIYTGRSTARTLTVLPDGTVLSERAAQKIRGQERSHEYAEQLLITHGARAPRADESPVAWLAEALQDIGARRVRHKGNHRYAFRLGTTKRERQGVVVALPRQRYPKYVDELYAAEPDETG